MRRRSRSVDHVVFDPEIEATARGLNAERRKRDQENIQRAPMARPLREYNIPDVTSTSSIARPTINGASDEALRLRLFPYSLRDIAKEWLKSHEANKFTNWNELAIAFCQKYKDLQRQCPHHEIPTWLLIQTFYNGLAHEVRISIDAAAGGALMGKTAAQAQALFEEMTANSYHWSSERSTSKKGSKYEVDAITSLSSKVDALSQQIKNISVGANAEMNALQGNNANSIPRNDPYSNTFNPGWRNHENFSWSNNQPQAPHNSNPPGFQQRQQGPPSQQPPQKSYIGSLLERLVAISEETNKKFDRIDANNKIVDTQIAHLAQQMSHVTQQVTQLQKAPPQFPGQPEPNPKNHHNVSAITLRCGKTLEEPMKPIVTSSIVNKDDITEEVEKAPSKPARVYVESAPFPHRLAKTRIEKKYGKFIELLKYVHFKIPFLEAICEIPANAKSLKQLLAKKKKICEATTVELSEECSAILLNTLPPKLNDPQNFTIPCSIGDVTIQRALCDLGASVSLMPNVIFKKLNFGDLRPTCVSLQLADRSIRYPLGVLEDVPLQVGKLTIPCDFFVMEMPEDARTPIILGRPCLATAGALIDVKHGKL
ncbi:uncharacterized protein LOC104884885 [Beta vulgaris subsp. vulgaris]|uniref:uncharacterized protein LOC104884885 n=1 Tax=Beta vulgaris subsp. vulgaris TaxID=3555 RepID=UPI00053FE994|nr:uncharacterized protein LOC104884885 [Beta vulgaris subsp. vulgaris]